MLPVKALEFPPIERATLSNGMKVVFARRSAVPTVDVAVNFDAGNAADDKAKLGTEALYLSLIEEGTPTRDSIGIAEEQERLGANIGESASMDNTTVTVSAPSHGRWRRTPPSPRSPVTCPTPARDAGRWTPLSTSRYRPRS